MTVGDSLTYTITVTNNGPNSAANVVARDVLPGAVTLEGISISTPAASGCAGTTTVTCSFGAIASGRSEAFTIRVRTTAAGTLSNTATVFSSTRDPRASNNSATVSTTVNPVLTHVLTVQKDGGGSGTITSTPATISCGTLCTAALPNGITVTLTASPSAGSSFTGWSGACSGTGPCVVTMDAPKTVTATFAPTPPLLFTLTVVKAGNGSGSVTSNPAGIECGATCSAPFTAGTPVTLTATPAAGNTFTGWSGACSGTGACTVTLDADKAVTATFAPTVTPTLTVTKAGTGTGTVTSNPAGIDCGATCTATFATGTPVTLTATPTAGNTFTGWSGACSGTGACLVTLDAAKTVTATFAPALAPMLTVTKAGTGTGTVTSSPAGIDCGATCTASFSTGTLVSLTATPAAGSTFSGWSGACSGTGACLVTLDVAKTVTATFAAGPGCHPSYPTVCIPPPPPNLNCSDIPYRRFRVIHTVPNPDPHGFDRDKDGIGCES